MVLKKHGLVALVLALMMIFGLTACSDDNDGASAVSGDASGTDGAAAGSGAMGRYVETEEPLPEGITSIVSIAQMPDGSLRMLGDGGGQGIGPWSVLLSTDGGQSWESVDYPWLADLTGSPINTAALTPNGAYIIHTGNVLASSAESDEPAEPGDTFAEDEAAGEESSEDGAEFAEDIGESVINLEYTFAWGDANGLTAIPFSPFAQGNNAMTTTLHAAENGDLISVGMSTEIIQIDTVGWKVKNTYQAAVDVGEFPGVAVHENTLSIHGADNTITLYDMDSGGAIEKISAEGETRASETMQKTAFVTAASDGTEWLYGNDTGVYRIPVDTTVSERLLDGGLTSLGMPTLNFRNIFSVGTDEYLAYATADFGFTSHLFRYVYNPDIPAEPSQVVRVYSMYDNKTIRQAISGYQTRNPNIRVEYQVGMDGSGGITAADTMRTLSTELLAGNGPDVLVMDDMDVDGYIKKNILADIGDVLSGADTLTNITGAFGQDGATYAIPARFSIPMLLGDGVANVKDLAGLASWLDTQYTYDIGVREDELMERFYASCSYRWYGVDGKLDEAAFRADLEQLGRIAQGISALEAVNSYGSMAVDTLLWYGGATAANYGMVSGFVDITLFDAAIQNRPTGSYTPFPADQGGIYVPGTILGVNAAAASLDGAKDFVKYVLSEDVQANELGDGFPVNSAAFESLSRPAGVTGEEGEMKAAISVTDQRTGEQVEAELSSGWPSDEFMTAFKNTLRDVSVPVKTNAVIREMIIDETSGYLVGKSSIDDTVRSLAQKMELYLSEQA